MYIPNKKVFEYWNHFVADWALNGPAFYGPDNKKLTPTKLRKARPVILDSNLVWMDVVLRHGGIDKTPEEMEQIDPANYEHAKGNFWGMVQTFIEW